MKKTLSFIMALMLIAGIIMPVDTHAAYADSAAGLVELSSGTLNVRSRASSGSSIVASLKDGSCITLISKTGSWWKVEYADGKYGYCHENYIQSLSSYAATVNTQSGNLNVRSGPGTAYSRKAKLSSGKTVLVLSSSGSWRYILYNGSSTGYVSSQYLVSANSDYPAVALDVPSYKQTDSRWAAVTVGTSGKTISRIGCTTTAIAMMESYRTGHTIHPDDMEEELSYTASGSVYWPEHYTAVTSSSNYLNGIYQKLQGGKPVLLGLKKSSGGQHWVVVTGYTGGSSLKASLFTVNDPGSSRRSNLQQVLDSYPNFYKYFYY